MKSSIVQKFPTCNAELPKVTNLNFQLGCQFHNCCDFATNLKENCHSCLKNTLAKVLPKRLIEVLIERKELTDKPLKQLNHREPKEIAHYLQHWRVTPNGTEGYRTAEVTLGGVDTEHISSKTILL